jgi:hypothetical protein
MHADLIDVKRMDLDAEIFSLETHIVVLLSSVKH